MCGGGGGSAPKPTPAPPPPAPVETAELKVGAEDTLNSKKKKSGTSQLKVPINKTTSSSTGLNTLKVT